jgi:ferritin-like metal-binding protein YciE
MATPRDLFTDALGEALHAARKFEKALTKMAHSAESDKLRSRLFGHRDVTKRQIERIEEAFGAIDRKPAGRTSKAGDALAREIPSGDDLAIVIHALKIEHFEIATYDALEKLAEGESLRRAKSLLQKNASESENAATELEGMMPTLEEDARAAS